MTDITPTDVRLQLWTQGYEPTPNIFKVPAIKKGWNAPDYITKDLRKYATPEAVIASWARRYPEALSTGVRLASGLGMIDADLDDEAMIGIFWRVAEEVVPELVKQAPARFGKGHKVALACRVEGEPFSYLPSRSYGENNKLEIFGGTILADGRRVRQFGMYGPHSEGVAYAFDAAAPALAERKIVDLPGLTRVQAAALINTFDAAMVAAGYEANKHFDASAGGTEAFDIAADAVFWMNDGGTADYEDLAGMIGRRCAANFIPGETGTNRTRCWIFWSGQHDCVGVYDHASAVSHYPTDKAPIDPTLFAEKLKEIAVLHGVTIPPPVPNWRERYENSTPRASLHNARLAIGAGGFACSHDVFHNKMFIGRGDTADVGQPLPPFCGEVTDHRVALLRKWVSDTYGRDFTEKHIRDAVVMAALECAFNPVTDMLAEAEANWDGVARLDRMAVDHFGCDDTPYHRACVRKTMVAAVARARHPGCKFDTILVLESPEGWNKSSAWLVLAGGPDNFSDESILGKASREAMEQLAGIWIHENAELAGLRKADIDVVRAYASRAEDRARPAYGHFLVRQPRQSIEVGTTNSTEYLQAQNGNRRFWPLRMNRPIDLGKLRAERLQLWGEAATLQSAGESLALDPELWPFAAAEQEARRVRDPWEALLETMTIKGSSGPLSGVYVGNSIIEDVAGELRVSTAHIFRNVLGMDVVGNIEVRHAKRLADAMRALGWSTKLFKMEGKVMRGYARARRVAGNE